MTEQGSAAPPAVQIVKIEGEPFLVCGCGLYRWSEVAGISWNKGSQMVEIYLINATSGSWPALPSREELAAFIESVREGK